MRRILRLFLVLAICGLIAAEVVLRWWVGLGDPPLARLDPVTEYELVPDASYQRWGNRITINQHGMRADPHPALPESNARHVLLIGDSVVYGGHFLDQSEIISTQLDSRIGSIAGLSGCTVRVLPMAASSWGPVNQAAFLEKAGSFGASTAGILLSSHDLYDIPLTPPDILPYRTSSSFTAVGDVVEALLERYVPRARPTPDPTPFEERAARSLSALDRLASQLRADKVDIVLILHPTVSERLAGSVEAFATLRDWAAVRNVPVIDLSDMQVLADDYRDNIHPTASGAARIASFLAPRLSAQIPPCG